MEPTLSQAPGLIKEKGIKAPGAEAIGKCPVCGGDVRENKKAYSCSEWKNKGCKFVIWKVIAKKTISLEIAKEFMEKGKTEKKIKGFKSKKGKSFEAVLELDNDKKVVFKFENKK